MTDIDIPHRVYRPRAFSDLGVFTHDGWRLKRAGIVYDLTRPRPELVAAAEAVAVDVLPTPAIGEGRYGVGFLGIHDGLNFCFVYVDWWVNQNELIHLPFISELDRPGALRPARQDEIGLCVWDIELVHHERRAWVETVMDNPAGPDGDAYLARAFTGVR